MKRRGNKVPIVTNSDCRFIWSAVLIGLLQLSIYLTLLLWLKFYSYPILNTISNDLSITDVAFPGVTICSPKAVNTERVERYVKHCEFSRDSFWQLMNSCLQKDTAGVRYERGGRRI